MYTYRNETTHNGIPFSAPIKFLIDRLVKSSVRESFFKSTISAAKKKGIPSSFLYEVFKEDLLKRFGEFDAYIPSEYKNKNSHEVIQALTILLCPNIRAEFEDLAFKSNKPESSPSIILLKRFIEATHGLLPNEIFSNTGFDIADLKIQKDYARDSVKESAVGADLVNLHMSGKELHPLLKLIHSSSLVFVDDECNLSLQSSYISAALDKDCIDRICSILEEVSNGESFDNKNEILAHTANAIYAIASLCKCQVIINLATEMYPFLIPFFDGVDVTYFNWFGFTHRDFVDISFFSSCFSVIETNINIATIALSSESYNLSMLNRAAVALQISRSCQFMLRKMESLLIKNSNLISEELLLGLNSLINQISDSWKNDGTDFHNEVRENLKSILTLLNEDSQDLLTITLLIMTSIIKSKYYDLLFENESHESNIDIIKKLNGMVSDGKGFDIKMIKKLHSDVNNSIERNNTKKGRIIPLINVIKSKVEKNISEAIRVKESLYVNASLPTRDDEIDSVINENHKLEMELDARNKEIEALNRSIAAKNSTIESLASRPVYNGYIEKDLSFALLQYIEESKQFTPEKALMIAGSVCPEIDILKSAVDSAKESSDFSQTPRLLKKLIVLGGDYLNAVNSGVPDAEARKLFSSKEFAANESESTMSNEDMRRDRQYKYKDKEHLFEQHLRIGVDSASANAIRVYFKVIDRRMVIAYCGPHKDLLKTV